MNSRQAKGKLGHMVVRTNSRLPFAVNTTLNLSLLISVKGTVTRFCACAASWFLFYRTFFQDRLLVKISSSIDPQTPEKAIISVFKSYLVHFGSFNAIFCIFVQALSRKFEVIEEKCTRPCSLLSVFLRTDQVWRVMWSSGFHFCLLRSPVNDLTFPTSS